ncbi:MAG: hypothetical protein NTW69_06310 [Chloroflexi bacterium]|nr:hypothetical protein [Chloroflexota bacterium]
MAKKAEELKVEEPELEETKAEELKRAPHTEYQLVDPKTANIAHGGVIYSVTNGKIACSSEVAQQLIDAGVLRK